MAYAHGGSKVPLSVTRTLPIDRLLEQLSFFVDGRSVVFGHQFAVRFDEVEVLFGRVVVVMVPKFFGCRNHDLVDLLKPFGLTHDFFPSPKTSCTSRF